MEEQVNALLRRSSHPGFSKVFLSIFREHLQQYFRLGVSLVAE